MYDCIQKTLMAGASVIVESDGWCFQCRRKFTQFWDCQDDITVAEFRERFACERLDYQT